jgi:hypothetical protein
MEGEVDKGYEHDVELFEPREDAPKSFETTGQPFDLSRRLDIAQSYSQTVSRFRLGGTIGKNRD